MLPEQNRPRDSSTADTHPASGMRAPLEACNSEARAPEPQAGNSVESLELLYEEHFAFVWRSLRALGVQPELLDDAAQEVFLVVHRRSEDFERRSSIRTWLFGISYRIAANFRRSAKRRPTEPLPGELLSERPSPEQDAQRAETARFVERFLGSIDQDQRAVFIACLLEGMSVPEAGEALGVNPNTLSSRLRAARQKFAAALSRREPQ